MSDDTHRKTKTVRPEIYVKKTHATVHRTGKTNSASPHTEGTDLVQLQVRVKKMLTGRPPPKWFQRACTL